MTDFVTRFRNDFLNKCGLTSSKYLFHNMEVKDLTTIFVAAIFSNIHRILQI